MSKIYVFVNGGVSGNFEVVALAEDGTVKGQSLSRSHALARENAAKLFKFPGHNVVWVDSPNDHPGVVEACKLWRAAEEAAAEKVEADAGALPAEAIQEMKKGHACDDCVHANVCGTAAAIAQHEARGGIVVISACYDHIAVPKE